MTVVTTIRLPEDLVDRIDERAHREYRSRSSLIAFLVARQLEADDAPAVPGKGEA
jgi:metal-responsive CopG/Arc/MetJ family transcriptional regulator